MSADHPPWEEGAGNQPPERFEPRCSEPSDQEKVGNDEDPPITLATELPEAEGVEEAALAELAGVGVALAVPQLRTHVEEHHARTLKDEGLHAGDI